MKKFSGVVRSARVGDIQSIIDLEQNFSAEESWYPGEIEHYLEKSTRRNKTPFIIAFGRASNGNRPPAGYCLDDMKRSRGEICSLVVDKPFRGRKLGRELLNRVCDSLRNEGAKTISLQVKEDNDAAICLYESAGFVKTKTLRGYYNGKDGVEMKCSYKSKPSPWN